MRKRTTVFTCVYALMLVLMFSTPAAAEANVYLPAIHLPDQLTPAIMHPDSSPYGLTYGEWSAKWWQWLLAQPGDVNPGFDATGIHCAQGQSGQVWFLAGTFDTADPLARSCTIPGGTALFFPVLNTSYIGFPTVVADTPQQALEIAKQDMDDFLSRSSLAAEVDGTPVAELLNYRRASPVFDVTLPSDNPFGITEVDCPADNAFLTFSSDNPFLTFPPDNPFSLACGARSAADGVYLMLAPLAPGNHTIHFRASGPVSLNVTYNIIVP